MTTDTKKRAYVHRLKRLGAQMKQLLATSGKSPTPKQIHELRITARRIQSGVQLAGIALELKKLCKALGQQRELDVAFEDATAFGLKRDHIRALRRKSQAKLERSLTRKRRKRLVKKLQRTIERIESARNLDLSRPLIELRKELLPWKEQPILTKKQAHQFRIAMRNARYVLEVVQKPQRPLNELQKHLGRVHDLTVLRKLAGSCPKSRAEEKQELRKARKLAKPAVLLALKQLS